VSASPSNGGRGGVYNIVMYIRRAVPHSPPRCRGRCSAAAATAARATPRGYRSRGPTCRRRTVVSTTRRRPVETDGRLLHNRRNRRRRTDALRKVTHAAAASHACTAHRAPRVIRFRVTIRARGRRRRSARCVTTGAYCRAIL